MSEATHRLVEALATSRVRVALPQAKSKRGQPLTEEGLKGIMVGYIRRKIGVAAIKAQCLSLLGRLEALGPGATNAIGRRKLAEEQERQWSREIRAHDLARKQGFHPHRGGFAKLN